jgi:hypothetical protein
MSVNKSFSGLDDIARPNPTRKPGAVAKKAVKKVEQKAVGRKSKK